jgi:hypothetical protein
MMAGAADNVKSCVSRAKTRTGWVNRAREIAVAIERPANGQFGGMFAVSYEPPA